VQTAGYRVYGLTPGDRQVSSETFRSCVELVRLLSRLKLNK